MKIPPDDTEKDMSGPSDEEQLEALSREFLLAMDERRSGQIDGAEKRLRAIVRLEPRLAEPHLALGRLLLDTGRLEEAEDYARLGLEHLDQSGLWTEDLPQHVVAGVAYSLLGEVLRRRADSDEVIFGDPSIFQSLLAEAKQCFEKAQAADPEDAYSAHQAFFMGAGDAAKGA
jgi:tetratricopeptide (TPR) repeat protein